MSERGLWSLVIGFLVVVAGVWTWILVGGLEPRLGLDLQGGVSANLIPAEGQGDIDLEVLDQTVQTIRERVDALGVAEPDITRQGDTIQVQLPGVADQEEAREVIGRTAQLQFRPVLEVLGPAGEGDESCEELAAGGVPDPDEEIVLCERLLADPRDPDSELPREQWSRLRLGPAAVSGARLTDARAEINPADPFGQSWVVAIEFDSEGSEEFAQITRELACQQGVGRQLAIVLDDVVESAPPLAVDIECGVGIPNGEAVINVAGGQAEAKQLAVVLRSGALPIQLDFGAFQTISPTLGTESLNAALIAGLIGFVLVAIYLIALYRGIGLAAIIELVVWGIVTVAMLIVLGELVGFTLTLAGIAGVIVSVGIAADSSIIYRERYRDEIRAGRTVRTAADHAYRSAWRTNLSGNIISLLAAVVLYVLAVGPVRGFAFTLGLSTLVDLLIFATFTRGMFGLIARNPRLAESKLVGLKAGVAEPAEGGAAAR